MELDALESYRNFSIIIGEALEFNVGEKLSGLKTGMGEKLGAIANSKLVSGAGKTLQRINANARYIIAKLLRLIKIFLQNLKRLLTSAGATVKYGNKMYGGAKVGEYGDIANTISKAVQGLQKARQEVIPSMKKSVRPDDGVYEDIEAAYTLISLDKSRGIGSRDREDHTSVKGSVLIKHINSMAKDLITVESYIKEYESTLAYAIRNPKIEGQHASDVRYINEYINALQKFTTVIVRNNTSATEYLTGSNLMKIDGKETNTKTKLTARAKAASDKIGGTISAVDAAKAAAPKPKKSPAPKRARANAG
jgi:hypothetical protein